MEKVKKDDQVIIYFSGHGDVERKTVSQPGFLLAWDAPSAFTWEAVPIHWPFTEVVTTLSTQNLAKVIVITDACHAGKLSGNHRGSQLTAASLAKQYANEVKNPLLPTQ
ncbi:MAG: caspase family protein [Saprospiraceae bacterium]|nr:caspase family protein [Candidatus Vicinibacter affinis]